MVDRQTIIPIEFPARTTRTVSTDARGGLLRHVSRSTVKVELLTCSFRALNRFGTWLEYNTVAHLVPHWEPLLTPVEIPGAEYLAPHHV
jgi:hypothetical protein